MLNSTLPDPAPVEPVPFSGLPALGPTKQAGSRTIFIAPGVVIRLAEFLSCCLLPFLAVFGLATFSFEPMTDCIASARGVPLRLASASYKLRFSDGFL